MIRDFGGYVADSILGQLGRSIWDAAIKLLECAFQMVDWAAANSVVDLGTDAAAGKSMYAIKSAASAILPMMMWISLAVALGLFFWQLAMTVLRGGRGFFQTAAGPVAYGVALTCTAGFVALLIRAADAVSSAILIQAFEGDHKFAALLSQDSKLHTALDAAANNVAGTLLGLIGIFLVIPVGVGYLLEMTFRTAALLILFATLPLFTAGLLSQTTASWFWKSLRWMVAAVMMKPALALVVLLGMSMIHGDGSFVGLLAGFGVWATALISPFVLFRLFAFVDPGTAQGQAVRTWAPTMFSPSGGGMGGMPEVANGAGAGEDATTARADVAASAARDGAGTGAAGESAGVAGAGAEAAGVGAGAAAGPVGVAAAAVALAAKAVNGAARAAPNMASAYMDATGIGHPGGGSVGSAPSSCGSSGFGGGTTGVPTAGSGGGGAPPSSGPSGPQSPSPDSFPDPDPPTGPSGPGGAAVPPASDEDDAPGDAAGWAPTSQPVEPAAAGSGDRGAPRPDRGTRAPRSSRRRGGTRSGAGITGDEATDAAVVL